MKLNTILIRFVAGALWFASGQASALKYTGVNLAGADFSETILPGTFGVNYTYPNQNEVDYFKSRGMNTIRLPFRWERLQRSLYATLDPTELARLDDFVSAATAKGMHVVLDPHNYARYHGNIIGTSSVPIPAFSNFWTQLANLYRTNERVIFGLMNEPNNMSTDLWRFTAQAAINAIRATGASNLILVPGNGWTGAHAWLDDWYGTPNGTAMLSINDPGDNFAFDVHQYLDGDSSGKSDHIVNAEIGVTRLTAFTQWCKEHNRRGFLGEFAVANSTIGVGIGDEALHNMLSYIEDNADIWLGWTWWAAGPWWGEYLFTLEPTNNYTTDRSTMRVLRQYLSISPPILRIISNNQIQFDTFSGFEYQAETSPDLATQNWTDVGSVINGTGTSVTIPMSATDPAIFYRVKVQSASEE